MSWFRKYFGHKGSEHVSGAANKMGESAVEADPVPSSDQIGRKARSEGMLRAQRIPVNEHLPLIESEADVRLRTPREVADRLLALVVVSFKAAENPDQTLVDTIVRDRNVGSLFTPDERTFIENPNPDDRARIQFSWRCEAAWPLLWALKFIDEPLGLPRETCDVRFLSTTVYENNDLASHGLRTAADILDEADLIYRCHWAVRQADLDGNPPPAGLDPGVTMERHHALNWLTRYCESEWDEVTTDT